MRRPVLAAAAIAVWVGGCSAAAPIPSPPPADGTTTLLLANRVDPPFRLERVVLSVDGQALPVSAVPPPGAAPATLGRVQLAPGEHTLQVLASAAGPAEGGAPSTIATLRTTQTFHVGDAPARLSLRLLVNAREPGPSAAAPDTVRAAPGLDVAFQLQGGELAAPLGQLGPAPTDEARCARLGRARRAACKAETAVARARAAQDLAAVGCALEPLATLQSLAAALEAAQVGGDAQAAAVVLDGEARLEALARDVERCTIGAGERAATE